MGSVISVFSNLLNNAWNMMISTYIPGTSVAVGYALMGIVLAVFSVRILGSALGVQFGIGSGVRGWIQGQRNEDNEQRRRDSRRAQGKDD